MSEPSARTCSSNRRRTTLFVLAALFFGLTAAPLLLAGDPPATPVPPPMAPLVPISRNAAPDLGQSEIQMWRMINSDRSAVSSTDETGGRAHPLIWDERLAAVAREHSEEMARAGYFSHQGLDGSLPYVRVTRAGIQWKASGENIAKFDTVVRAQQGFMDEPKFQHNHRSNILNTAYTHVGVGIARGADGYLYITQEFATLF
jgi:uncharacterized protein YkwD